MILYSRELRRAAEVIRRGGVIAYATEYCFGIGCDPRRPAAVERLRRIKRRPAAKGLILIAADASQLAPFVSDVPARAGASWPGPYTWLLAPRARIPRWITRNPARIAVRVTAHPQAAALCRVCRMAIVSTSANRTHEPPARSYREVLARLGAQLDYVLPGRVGSAPAPTPIRDALTGELVRAG